jgi:ABC-type protease/lipase transport system fused ATPase/permease subunit
VREPSQPIALIIGIIGIIGIPVLVVTCVNSVSKESERQAKELIATKQRENQEAIKNHHALIGMTAAEVRQAWGEPKRITRTTTKRGEYEEWHYGSEEKGATLVFVNGIFKSGTRNDGK